ncbi:MAG: glutathione peroxidase [Planctomycetes bacterium]|nr:glutathione peroxidase [Planctomycetota bacterium]
MKSALRMSFALVVLITMMNPNSLAEDADEKDGAKPQAEAKALDQEMKTLQGKKVNLAEKYQGKVVLLVNVASKCGYTPQYKELQALHEKYTKKGLAVVGVPCNQFGGQEPGTAKEIAQFCEDRFGVEFDMMAKVDVNGPDAAPLYKYLTSKETDPKFAGDIKWNFEKFVFDREGNVVARFNSKAKPDSKEVVEVIEAELAKKAKS